ncbi:Hypothetical protein SMAX5B_011767 [Scophthalmus maximus]|uniref:Uncharacterized protein n=1 Tax=Scophthalmus maximus TaxID=52904 RepID=A0A2U9AXS1_SCOMX|nr:Hypothetical protein SMAX5B_011767 [Scophthalmus maximus]
MNRPRSSGRRDPQQQQLRRKLFLLLLKTKLTTPRLYSTPIGCGRRFQHRDWPHGAQAYARRNQTTPPS